MDRKYLQYYERYNPAASFIFLRDSIWARSKVQKISLLNRQKDYVQLAQDSNLRALHHKLHQLLLQSVREWQSYDYGEGYFYQGLKSLRITGLRNTESRAAQMELGRRLKGQRVLEIGCNTGFLSLWMAPFAKEVVGFDINPFLVDIARIVQEFMKVHNCQFFVSSFEDYQPQEKFDTVLSFANHSTYDQNTHQDIQSYFAKCVRLLKPEGVFLFESHPPQYEGKGLEQVKEVMKQFFKITEERILNHGTFLDQGRTFIVAQRKDV